MKRNEYLNQILVSKLQHKAELKKIMKNYILGNNPIKIGDIITDHYHSIRVDSISFYFSERNPSCIYHGLLYTKAGKPSKKNKNSQIYQMNLKLINKGE